MSNPLTGQFASTAHSMNLGSRQLPNSGAGQSGVHAEQHGSNLQANAGASQQHQQSLVPLAHPVEKDTFATKPKSLFARFNPSFKTLTTAASAVSLHDQLIRRIYTKSSQVQPRDIASSAAASPKPSTATVRRASATARSKTAESPISMTAVFSGAQSFVARTAAQAQSIALRGAVAATALMASTSAFADDVRPYVPTEPTSNFSVELMNFMARHDHAVDLIIPIGALVMIGVAFAAGAVTGTAFFTVVYKVKQRRDAAAAKLAADKARNTAPPQATPIVDQGSGNAAQTSTTSGQTIPAAGSPAPSSATPSPAPDALDPLATPDTLPRQQQPTPTSIPDSNAAPSVAIEDQAILDTPAALAEIRRLVDDKILEYPNNPRLKEIQAVLHAPGLVVGLINRDQLPADKREVADKFDETLNLLQSILGQMPDKNGQGDGGNDQTTESDRVEELRREIAVQLVDPKKQIAQLMTTVSGKLEHIIEELIKVQDAQPSPIPEIGSAIANFRPVLSSMRRTDASHDLLRYYDELDSALGYLGDITDRKIKALIEPSKVAINQINKDLEQHAGLASTPQPQHQGVLQAEVQVIPTGPFYAPDSSGDLQDSDLLSVVDPVAAEESNSDPAVITNISQALPSPQQPISPPDDFDETEFASQEGDAPRLDAQDVALHEVPSSSDAAASEAQDSATNGQSYTVDAANARVDVSDVVDAADEDELLEAEAAPDDADADATFNFGEADEEQLLAESRPTEVPLDADELPPEPAVLREVPVDDGLLDDKAESRPTEVPLDADELSPEPAVLREVPVDDGLLDEEEDILNPAGVTVAPQGVEDPKKKNLTEAPALDDTLTSPVLIDRPKNEIRGNNHLITGSGQAALVDGHDGTLEITHDNLGTITAGLSHIAGYATEPGKDNEDGILIVNTINPETGRPVQYQACIDGMGGHSGGAPAMKIIAHSLAKNLSSGMTPEQAIDAAAEDIQNNRSLPNGAGAVLVLIALERDENATLQMQAWVVGDARAVVFRPSVNGEILRTEDQSVAQMQRNKGNLKTDFEQRSQPYSNVVLNSIAKNSEEMDTPNYAKEDLQTNDWVVLGSDGLWDNFDVDEVYALIKDCNTPEEARQKLYDATLVRMNSKQENGKQTIGTKPDNLSIFVTLVQRSLGGKDETTLPSQASQVTMPYPSYDFDAPPAISAPALYDESLDPNTPRAPHIGKTRPSHTETIILGDVETPSPTPSGHEPRALRNGDKCLTFVMGDPVELTWNEKNGTLSDTKGYRIHGPVVIRQIDNPNMIQGVVWPASPTSTLDHHSRTYYHPSTKEYLGHPLELWLLNRDPQAILDSLPQTVSSPAKIIILKEPEPVLKNGTSFKIKMGEAIREYQFDNGKITPVNHEIEFPKSGNFKAWQSSGDVSNPAESTIAYIRDGVIFSSQRWSSGDHGNFKTNTPEVALVMEQLIHEEHAFVERVNNIANELTRIKKIHRALDHFADWITEVKTQFEDLEEDRHSLSARAQALDNLNRMESMFNMYLQERYIANDSGFASHILAITIHLQETRKDIESIKINFAPARAVVPREASTILLGLPTHDQWTATSDSFAVKFNLIWVNETLVKLATSDNVNDIDAKAMVNYLSSLLAIESKVLKDNLPLPFLNEVISQLNAFLDNKTENFQSIHNQLKTLILGTAYENTLIEIYDYLKTSNEDEDRLKTLLASWSESLQHARTLHQLNSIVYDDVPLILDLVNSISQYLNVPKNDYTERQLTRGIGQLATVLYVRKNESRILSGQIKPARMPANELQELYNQYNNIKQYARTLPDNEKTLNTIIRRLEALNSPLDSKISAEIKTMEKRAATFDQSSSVESIEQFKSSLTAFKSTHRLTGKPLLDARVTEIISTLESLTSLIKQNQRRAAAQTTRPAAPAPARPKIDARGLNPDLGQAAKTTRPPAPATRPARPAAAAPAPADDDISLHTPMSTGTDKETPATPMAVSRVASPTAPSGVLPIYAGNPDGTPSRSGSSVERLIDSPLKGGIKGLALATINGRAYQIFHTDSALAFANELFRDLPASVGATIIFRDAYTKLFEMLKQPEQHRFLYIGMDQDVEKEDRHMLAMVYLQVFLQSLAPSISGLKTEFRFKANTQEPVLVLIGRKSEPKDDVHYIDLLGDKQSGSPVIRRGKLKDLLQDSSSASNRMLQIRNPGN